MEVLRGIKVRNMVSQHSGNEVRNQFIIETPKATIFQSYDTVIAAKMGGVIYLDEDSWDYSTTTGKYRNQFLHEGIAETRRKIEAGIYKLAKLN